MLGPKQNPYKYMAKCQLYVCLSISEACPFVINESKILHIPVITTDFPSAYEFISNNINGRICRFEDIPPNIATLINSKNEYCKILENIKEYTYNNNIIENKLLELLNL